MGGGTEWGDKSIEDSWDGGARVRTRDLGDLGVGREHRMGQSQMRNLRPHIPLTLSCHSEHRPPPDS